MRPLIPYNGVHTETNMYRFWTKKRLYHKLSLISWKKDWVKRERIQKTHRESGQYVKWKCITHCNNIAWPSSCQRRLIWT